MTGPRVEPAPTGKVLSGDEWEAAQYVRGALPSDPKKPAGLSRVLTGDEWEHVQTLPGPALKTLKLPAMPTMAPRDALRSPADVAAQPKGKLLAEFNIKDPSTYANPLLRQVINPALDNPFLTAGMGVAPFAAAGASPLLGAAVGVGMVAPMVYHVAKYGWQKAHELHLSPEDRAKAEADPERISGESAAVQAAMLGLAPLIHVGVKGGRGMLAEFRANQPMEIPVRRIPETMPSARPADPAVPAGDVSDMTIPVGTNKFIADLEQGAASARIPNDVQHPAGFEPTAGGARLKHTPRQVPGLEVQKPVTPGKIKPVETLPASASLEERAAYNEAVRAYEAERLAQDKADLSAARTEAAEKIAKADAMRPRRRAANEPASFFESEQGAEVLGMTAGRHGLAAEASPYHPESSLDASWKAGHAAATESFPEGFSMGGALTDNRIPGAGELPSLAKGIDGLEQSHPVAVPEGATPETAALAAALKPSPFRGHTTESLAEAALDAQAQIEAAQGRVTSSTTRDHVAWDDPEHSPETIFHEDRGAHATDIPSPASEKALARAKTKLAQIEREFALRGVSGDDLAGVMQSAKELRLEREGMAQDASLSGHMGDESFSLAEPGATKGTGGALAAVEGTGAVRTRGLAASVERDAIASNLTETLGDLPEYNQINMADQAARVQEFIARDPALARRVALGEVPAPPDLLPESVFTAIKQQATANGDVATIYELAHGDLTKQATTMGQRLRALGEKDPSSPVAAIQGVVDARTGGAKNVAKATASEVASINKHITKSLSTEISSKAGADFTNALRC